MPNVRQLPPKPFTHQAYAVVAAGTFNFDIENVLGYQNLLIRLFADTESGTSTIDLKVQGFSESANLYYDIPGASLVQVTANMTVPIDLVLAPEATAVANRVVSRPLPRRLRIVMVVGGTSFKIALESELN